MTAPIRVTVDGEPVTRDVTLEQVREYLRAKGWAPRRNHEHEGVVWAEEWRLGWPGIWLYSDHDMRHTLACLVRDIASVERNHPAAVLREIAAIGKPAPSVEPITTEEIDALDCSDEWARSASGFDAMTVRRLISTVRAKEAEVQRLTTEVRRLRSNATGYHAETCWTDGRKWHCVFGCRVNSF